MSLLAFRSGHMYPESNIDRIEPSITVRKRVQVTISQPNEVVIGGRVAIQVMINSEIEVDVDQVLYPKSSGKRDAEPLVVNRTPNAITKTLNGVDIFDYPALEDPALRAVVQKHLRRLNEYYMALGNLTAPVPADNSLIGETAVVPDTNKLQANINARTQKFMKVLDEAGVLAETVSEPYNDVFAFLDDCAEKGVDLSLDELLDAVLVTPVVSTTYAGESEEQTAAE